MHLFSNCMEWNDYFNVSIKKVSVFEMPAIIRCMKLIMESIKPNVKTLVPCVLFNVGCLAEHDWKASAQTEFSSWLCPHQLIFFLQEQFDQQIKNFLLFCCLTLHLTIASSYKENAGELWSRTILGTIYSDQLFYGNIKAVINW